MEGGGSALWMAFSRTISPSPSRPLHNSLSIWEGGREGGRDYSNQHTVLREGKTAEEMGTQQKRGEDSRREGKTAEERGRGTHNEVSCTV